MATTENLLTAEEFERLPDDGKRYELIDGKLCEMVPLTMWHGEVEANLATFLGRHVCARGLGRMAIRVHPD